MACKFEYQFRLMCLYWFNLIIMVRIVQIVLKRHRVVDVPDWGMKFGYWSVPNFTCFTSMKLFKHYIWIYVVQCCKLTEKLQTLALVWHICVITSSILTYIMTFCIYLTYDCRIWGNHTSDTNRLYFWLCNCTAQFVWWNTSTRYLTWDS